MFFLLTRFFLFQDDELEIKCLGNYLKKIIEVHFLY